MAARERLPPWHERMRLPNGRDVLIRPIRPEDAEPIRASFSLLQPEEVRQRFLYALKEMTPEMAERMTRINPKNEFALVAAEPLPPGEALVLAVARASLREDSARDAEFALIVGRLVAGQGLGKFLLRRLLEWSRRRRLHSLRGTVSLDNTVMLQLAQELGFSRQLISGEQGTARIELNLR